MSCVYIYIYVDMQFIRWSIHLSIDPPLHLSKYPYIHPSVHLSGHDIVQMSWSSFLLFPMLIAAWQQRRLALAAEQCGLPRSTYLLPFITASKIVLDLLCTVGSRRRSHRQLAVFLYAGRALSLESCTVRCDAPAVREVLSTMVPRKLGSSQRGV